MAIPSTTIPTVFYLLCASMTILCILINKQEQIDHYEAMFEKFRDEYKETDHYRLLYSAIQLFASCDCSYLQDDSDVNSEINFRSLSFSEQIDLVSHAFVDLHLLPSQLTNPVKESLMTEADFRTKYQAWPQSFMDKKMPTWFNPERTSLSELNCMSLDNFLSDVSSNVPMNQDACYRHLFSIHDLFYKNFLQLVYGVKESTSREIAAGGSTTLKYRTNGVILVTIVVILLVALGAVAFMVYCLFCRSSGKKTKARKSRLSTSTSSSLFSSTNATTKKSSTGSHVTTSESH